MFMQEDLNMAYQCVYPDVYYKVMPFVMMACDEFDVSNHEMLSPAMIRETTDRIYEDVCKIHPDLVSPNQYRGMTYGSAESYSSISDTYVEAQQFNQGGFFNDLITVILLNEFFGRRRRRYWR